MAGREGPAESLTLPIDVPLDLRRTLSPLHGRFADDGWWLTARTGDGPGSLRIRRTRDDLIGEAWGDGASQLLERLGAIAGLEDDPSAFSTSNEIVAALHRRNPGARFGRTGLVLDSAVIAVCGQRVTAQEAGRAIGGLRRRFSEPAPGPAGLRLPPDPAAIAEAPYWELHEIGLEKRRADALGALARHWEPVEALAVADSDEAAAALGSIRGVGAWTVAKTLEVSHGDPDRPAVGDFHIKHMVVHHLTGRDRGSDEEMVELLEPFRPHRGRVVRLLSLLGRAPRFGPRRPPRDISPT